MKILIIFAILNILFISKVYSDPLHEVISLQSSDRTQLALSKNDYDDVRVFNSDNLIWDLSKNDLKMHLVYSRANNQLQTISLSKFYKEKALRLTYSKFNHKFVLTNASYTNLRSYYFNFTEAQNPQACMQDAESSSLKILKELSSTANLATLKQSINNGLIDKSCYQLMP